MLINRDNTHNYIKKILFFLIFLSICLFLIPIEPIMPGVGLDPSWQHAMNVAISEKLELGKNIIFTYGPYIGICTHYFHPKLDSINMICSSFLSISFGYLIYNLLRKEKVTIIFLFFAIFFLISNTNYRDFIFYLAPFMLFFDFIRSDINNTERSLLHDFILYFPIGLIVLIKCSFIIPYLVILPIIFFILISSKRAKEIITISIIIFSGLIFFWTISDQKPANLLSYFISNIPLISGFSEGMSSTEHSLSEVILFWSLGIIIIVQLLFLKHKPHSFILSIVSIFIIFLSFKSGFVRQDEHTKISFSILIFVAFFIYLFSKTRSSFIIFCLCTITSFTSYKLYNNTSFSSSIKGNFVKIYDGIKLRSQHKKLKTEYQKKLDDINKQIQLPILSGSSDIYNFEQSYLLASKNIWNPRPVFQSYTAYTKELLYANRDHLLSDKSPDNLFFKVETIDGRLPSTEDGNSWPLILSNYKPIKFENDYLILKKRYEQNRDIKLDLIQKQSGRLNQEIKIPDHTGLLFCRIKIEPTFLGKFITRFFRSDKLYIITKENNNSEKKYKLISGMVETDYLISPLVEDTKDYYNLYKTDRLKYKNVKSVKIIPNDRNFLIDFWQDNFEIEFYNFSN
ncbi:hypothetical protein SAMN05421825_1965 [Epilithonimonas hungarica]|uniref:Transmembrane protein n=1 Tax=Epilithonimonas hungarica TaxID=454006 RepID=A0A1G7NF48_9FLAO|nr:hypothetical protein SAMN05421825_1965 [Epilithonimonas hungarica]